MSRLMWWLSGLALIAVPAEAHDWYPEDCCSKGDCRPINVLTERVQTRGDGYDVWILWRESNDRRPPQLVHDYIPERSARWSEDNQFHVCPYFYEQNRERAEPRRANSRNGGSHYVRCFFRPPPNS